MIEPAETYRPKGPFPLFIHDLEEDTRGWSGEDRYRYLKVCVHIFHQGGLIEDSDDILCDVIGLRKGRGYKKTLGMIRSQLQTYRDANPLAKALETPFLRRLVLETKGHWLTQKRVLREVGKAFNRSKIAQKGGLAKAAAKVADSTEAIVPSGVLPSPSPLSKKDSVANATGADAPSAEEIPPEPEDLKTRIFGPAREWLAKATGKPDGQVRRLLGKWVRDHGDGKTLDVVTAAARNAPLDPVPYIEKLFKERNHGGNHANAGRQSPHETLLAAGIAAGLELVGSVDDGGNRGTEPGYQGLPRLVVTGES